MSNVQIMCAWCQKVGIKRYSLSMGSEVKSFCSEKCFAACRRAYFKRNKVRNRTNFTQISPGYILMHAYVWLQQQKHLHGKICRNIIVFALTIPCHACCIFMKDLYRCRFLSRGGIQIYLPHVPYLVDLNMCARYLRHNAPQKTIPKLIIK